MGNKMLIKTLKEYGINSLEDILDLIDHSFDAIVLNNTDDKIIYASKAIERISGIDRKKIVGKTPEQLMDEGIILNQSVNKIGKGIANANHVLHTGITAFITSSKVPNRDKPDDYLILSNYRELNELKDLADELRKVSKESEIYQEELLILRSESALDNIVANSKPMKNLLNTVYKVAHSDITINLTGESGVGKNVIAKLIHDLSSRKGGPYIHINCGAIPENLVESELFGYEGGAFSGALKKGKPGLLEIAHEGTVFLDEIGDLPLNLQVKLLKTIEDHKITRIGSTRTVDVNLRIICASNRNILELVDKGMFRSDLYYRINQFPLKIPPLRERLEEIVHFCHYFLEKYNTKYNTKKSLSTDVLEIFESYKWPGNIRELENLIERLILVSDKNKIAVQDLPENIFDNNCMADNHQTLKEYMDKCERDILVKTIKRYGSRKSAKILGIDYSTLKRKKKKHILNN